MTQSRVIRPEANVLLAIQAAYISQRSNMNEYQKFDVEHRLARALCIVSLAIAFVVAIVWTSHRRPAPATTTAASASTAIAENVAATAARDIEVGQQPKRLKIYSHNWLFVGAQVSLKNPEGKILWVTLPTKPNSNPLRTPFETARGVPNTFDMTHGYSVVVHTADGNAYRYNVPSVGTYGGTASFFLHVCDGAHYGHSGPLRPMVWANWLEKHFEPVTKN